MRLPRLHDSGSALRWFAWAAALVLSCGLAHAAGLPYDERADAAADVQQALHRAQEDNKDVLLVFGANWCPDCRVLDSVLRGKDAAPFAERFVIVKVDVGNFDKNLGLAKRYEIPLRQGIPAAVVLGSDEKVRYVTRSGELANAHHMGESGIVAFFARFAPAPPVAGR
jgi:thioredoxin 1